MYAEASKGHPTEPYMSMDQRAFCLAQSINPLRIVTPSPSHELRESLGSTEFHKLTSRKKIYV